MKLLLAGPGAFGIKHLDALKNIDDTEVIALVGSDATRTQEIADRYGIPQAFTELDTALDVAEVEAAILTTPTALHAMQAIQCMKAGKHVAVEIPLSDSWADAEEVDRVQRDTGLVCMVGHTRRFNPSHRYLHEKIKAGDIRIQSMVAQTFFFRRSNINALGEPRDWTDHLLWHHAAHTVDLFQYQTGEEIVEANILQGPKHPELGIAMDMSIQMKTEAGQILTLALSFNNDGPLGTFFRYICDNGTFVARNDDLVDGYENAIDVSGVDASMNGIELQDREFVESIREGREPRASVGRVLNCYRWLQELERQLGDEA